MARVEEVIPEIVWLDLDYGVLVTRYVPGTNWDQHLQAGRIDARMFAIAGAALRMIHEVPLGTSAYPEHVLRLSAAQVFANTETDTGAYVADLHEHLLTCRLSLLHGDFSPHHVLITPGRRLTVMGWKAVAQGASISDVAHFLASLLLRSRTQPYTENSYIDAGRAFLGAYGDHDQSLLAPLVGVEILDLISRPQQMSVATIDPLRTPTLGLLRQTVPLPW